MISMSSQSRPNQKKGTLKKISFFCRLLDQKEREREIFGKEEDRSTQKKKHECDTQVKKKEKKL